MQELISEFIDNFKHYKQNDYKNIINKLETLERNNQHIQSEEFNNGIWFFKNIIFITAHLHNAFYLLKDDQFYPA